MIFVVSLCSTSAIIERGEIDSINGVKCPTDKPIATSIFPKGPLTCIEVENVFKESGMLLERFMIVNIERWVEVRFDIETKYSYIEERGWVRGEFKVRRDEEYIQIWPERGALFSFVGDGRVVLIKSCGRAINPLTSPTPTTVGADTSTPNRITTTTATPTTVGGVTSTPSPIATTTATPTTVGGVTSTPSAIATTTSTPTTVSGVTSTPSTTPTTTSTPTTVGGVTSNPSTIATTTSTPTTVGGTTPKTSPTSTKINLAAVILGVTVPLCLTFLVVLGLYLKGSHRTFPYLRCVKSESGGNEEIDIGMENIIDNEEEYIISGV